jgi:hypothetical protein
LKDEFAGYAKWAALANQNVLVGGPVWPIFQKFYQ